DEEHVLVINAIANDPTQSNLFMDIEFFREEFDIKDDFYTGFVGDSQNSTEIKEEDEAATYISVIEMQEMVEENMGAMYTMIGIIVVIATVISLITLLVVGGIVVNNNSKTISILRVLGYRSLEIRKFTTSSYKWVITIVYFGSLNFIEFAINTIISYILSETDFNLNVNIDLKWALIGYFIIMLTYLFSMKMTERKINKVLLSESLKIDE
ncbi:MAG: hypothetical protein JJV90_01535, partial [Spiroplasma sp.]|nr:hypothetical protein [Mycoplasmatales bacterium]